MTMIFIYGYKQIKKKTKKTLLKKLRMEMKKGKTYLYIHI